MASQRSAVLIAGAPSSGRRTTLAALAGRTAEVDLRIIGSDDCNQPFLQRIVAALFLVDPRRSRFKANETALEAARAALASGGRSADEVPLLFLLNKLDLPLDAAGASMFARFTGVEAPAPQLIRAPIAVLRRQLSWPRCDYAETIATEGIGVDEALTRALALAAG